MRMPRWRVLLPVALVLTVLAPTLRELFWIGPWLPDPWLLLLLVAVPEPPPALRQRVLLVALLGLLRGTVSALPVETSLAGLGLALAVRGILARHLVLARLPGACLAGTLGALAAAGTDLLTLLARDLPVPIMPLLFRAVAAGLLWALAARPGVLASPGRPRLRPATP